MGGKGDYVFMALKDTRTSSHGCRERPIENVYVKGPNFCATPLFLPHPVKTTYAWTVHQQRANNRLREYGFFHNAARNHMARNLATVWADLCKVGVENSALKEKSAI